MQKTNETAGPRRPVTIYWAALGLSLGLMTAGSAEAGIRYRGGVGDTVYGVAPYSPPPQANPVFIPNNVTNRNDILASPGHGFLLASPVVANNIFETPIVPLTLWSFANGGGNINGAFGSGRTVITGPRIGFRLSDVVPGSGSASYMISSWEADFTVGKGGFNGDLGTFLAIGGTLSTSVSAAAASLVSAYSINNGPLTQTAPLVLAAAGNGNFQALGNPNGQNARIVLGPGGRFRGLAANNFVLNLAQGTSIHVISTLTAFADPASIEVIDIPLDLTGPDGVTLPDFAIAQTQGAIPEPSTWAMLLAGFAALGTALRRVRRSAAA